MSDTGRAAANVADAKLLHDRVTAAFGATYLIGPEIGRGGMAVVYSAEDVRLQRPVALKVLPPDLAFKSDVRERFVREAQTAARLNHPHIVSIYAVHEEAGMVCFAMALVSGDTVGSWLLRESRPSPAFVAKVLEETADALAYAHACGVVHRDIKPDNILLEQESHRALVTDFGIARAMEGGSRLTHTGVAVGTPAFMSPEQATGDKDVDGRSDLYSLGVVGYLMLAGRLPFEATSTPAMLVKHVSETPPSVLSLRPSAPPALAAIIEKCLAKRPADRWDSALAMRDALRRVQRDGSLDQGGAVRQAYAASAPGRPPQRVPPRAEPDAVAGEWARKAGHRAEDWSPNRAEPGRRLAGLPPMPQFPPLPAHADRDEQREWKEARREALREWRRDVRLHRDEDEWSGWGIATASEYEDRLIRRFKNQIVWSGGVIVFLGVINVTTSPFFPWAIFPAMGMSMGVLGRYLKLRSRGISWSRIWDSERFAEGEPDVPLPKPTRIERAAHAFRKHLRWLGASVVAGAASFAIGAGFNFDPMIVPFVGSILTGLGSAQLLTMDFLRLRALGVSPGQALGGEWRAIAAASDDRSPTVRFNEQLSNVAGPQLLESAHGATVRSAVEDCMAIVDAASRLSDADKLMVPDVVPTANALQERIVALATGLERLDRDIPVDVIAQLDARIQSVEAEPASAPDRERRMKLLARQRGSLQELVERRTTMARQLESASMALRSLRFDMVKLRTLGVGAAINDVTSATQEARALSVDIARVLEAVDEVRKL